MAIKSLAVKYRPNNWDDVIEQDAIKVILQQQLKTETMKNSYLFCGGAGTGKTTCARIFASELNHHKGNAIEMDAASNNSVDDVRSIIRQAKTKSLESEYKVFILDECHSLSNTAWQAMLKLIEEPPAKSIFIFCTTEPERIPKTILSRVQRYNFTRISNFGIVSRLRHILESEYCEPGQKIDNEVYKVLEYIAKLADGGMRDAITMMDKCLSFSTNLTIENVTKALGTSDYVIMLGLTANLLNGDAQTVIEIIEDIYHDGIDLKQFIKQYMSFLLDVCKYGVSADFKYLQVPHTELIESEFDKWVGTDLEKCFNLLDTVIKLNSDIKWDTVPKATIEATLLLSCAKEEN